jgi:Rps23 Pro-64 3,4-dihydroxylase Tpa1-like proline 4-hydroxylase
MIFDYKKWNATLEEDAKNYRDALPYPHIVFDNFLEAWAAEKVLDGFPRVSDEGWIHYIHFNEKKHGLNKLEFIPEFIRDGLIQELNSAAFLKYLEKLTGINHLVADTTFEGGGIHQSEPGGFLNIHADFTVHPHKKNWRRRVNLLVYLNKDWKESYDGDLELWDRDMNKCTQKITPHFNRIVIFNTDKDSYHGVPEPLKCPAGSTRKSIALYYYTEEKIGSFKRRATNYRARPEDGIKSLFIWLDKKIISLYSGLKGRLNLNDDFASKILNKIGGKKK